MASSARLMLESMALYQLSWDTLVGEGRVEKERGERERGRETGGRYLLEWRAEGTPVAGGEEAGMRFEFRGGDERRERAGLSGRDPGARGAVGAE